jgi:8-oxo-dGTP diphosphatase
MRQIATLILENPRGQILLYLRDDEPSIPFPHHWDLFGGHVEPGETVQEALVREVREELDLDLDDFTFFRRYECLEGDAFPNVKHVFTARIDRSSDSLTLREGERLAWFDRSEIPGLRIANILKAILLDFIAVEDAGPAASDRG